MPDFGLEVVGVDVGAKFDLFDRDPAFFLAGFLGLLCGLEPVLAPIHDADHDGSGVRGHLDEVEAGFGGNSAGFFDGNDSDLLSLRADQANGTQTDLVVDSNSIVDSPPPLLGDTPVPCLFDPDVI